jgi:hypothetical protein
VRVPGVPACPLDRNVVRDLDSLLVKRPAHETEYPVKDDAADRKCTVR